MTSLASKPQPGVLQKTNKPLAVWFAGAALFTISWDRLLNFTVGTLNLKLPIILFRSRGIFRSCRLAP